MHLDSIRHRDHVYDASHLNQVIKQFDWRDCDKQNMSFSVRVRYSNHCYSKTCERPSDEDFVVSQNRIFCPHRHSLSQVLPAVIGGIIEKPTTSIGVTYESKNHHVYRIAPTVPLEPGERYAIFFSLKASNADDPSRAVRMLDLFVESAYPRTNRVDIDRNLPFGKLAEQLLKK